MRQAWSLLFAFTTAVGARGQPAATSSGPSQRPVFGRSVQIDPLLGSYYRDRSAASIAAEIRANGYAVVHYIVTADTTVNRDLLEALHREGIGTWYATFGNGTYSRKDLPAGWESWRMITRRDLAGSPLSDGYTRLCLNNADYRRWKKAQIAKTLREYPFDGVDIMEPHWPEYPGRESPAYACFCRACESAFEQMFPGGRGLPDILDPGSPRSPERDPPLWRRWLAFRQSSLTGFLNDLVNGPGGVRDSVPGARVCTWTLALMAADGLNSVREDSGEDAGEIVRRVRPDMHCLQTHWPDWMKRDLPPDYVTGYRPFIGQIRAAAGDQPIMIQADVGSRPENRRDWRWVREFERACEGLGAAGSTFYEFSLGGYIYLEPPRVSRLRVQQGAVELSFTRRVDPESADEFGRFTLSQGQVTAVRVDGSLVTLSVAGVPHGSDCTLVIRGIADTPQRRLYKDRPAAVLDSQTVHFTAR